MSAHAVVGLVCLALACSASAHHSPSAYDLTKEVVFTGTVTNVAWMNPHIYFTVAVTGADGSVIEQEIQAGSISVNTALGLEKGDLLPGAQVTVRAHPNRRGAGKLAWALDMTTNDGRTRPLDLLGRAEQPAATVAAASIAGRWVPAAASAREVVTGLRGLQLTEAARAAAADIGGQRSAGASAGCSQWSAPRVMALPVLRTIEVGDDSVKIAFDWMSSERIVHLADSEHPARLEPSAQGHSIGHWEGNTLVIDTVGFLPDRAGLGGGVPSGLRKHLAEKLSLSADRRQLHYQFTVEDPEYFAGAGTFTVVWDHRPELAPSGAACNAENARRFLAEE
jgi:hypothetical protein